MLGSTTRDPGDIAAADPDKAHLSWVGNGDFRRREGDGVSEESPPAAPFQEAVFILGTKLNPVTVDDVHSYINQLIEHRQKGLILHLNVHCVNLCQKYRWLKEFVNHAQMVFCDGDGVRWGARLLGLKPPPKITYDRWIWQVAELAEARRYRFYFLGGRPGVAAAAAENLRQRFPRLEIVGTHHGHFKKEGEDNERVIAQINQFRPDILVLGFGMPIQERWLRDHWEKIAANVFLTGGAVFDYASGNAKRAPEWMIRSNLEWLFRFVQEPRRLLVRYFWGNPCFLIRVFRQAVFQGDVVK